jgi:hypothetical protein
MWPKDWFAFAAGLLGLLVGILNLHHFHSHYTNEIERYFGPVWFFFAAVFIYRAYRPGARS